MKITDIRVTLIDQELESYFRTSRGPITHVRECVAEVRTDEGVVGIGEAKARSPQRTGRFLLDWIKPRLMGENPLETEQLWRQMFAFTYEAEPARAGWSTPEILNATAAVDIALWDLKGKVAGLPIYRLLGGQNNPQPFYSNLGYYFPDMSLTEQADRLVSFVAKFGLDAVKMKIGRSVKEDIERVTTFRSALGDDIDLMADANCGYSVLDAIEAGKAYLDLNLYWYEEPVQWHDRYKGTGQVADAVPIPIHAGESENNRFQCRDLIVDGKVKFMSFDATVAGGVTEWLKVAAFSEMHNVVMAPHCEPQVHGHLMAAAPNASLLEVHPDEERHPLWDHGFVDRAEIKGNTLILTDRPGFGVEFEPEYLKKHGTALE